MNTLQHVERINTSNQSSQSQFIDFYGTGDPRVREEEQYLTEQPRQASLDDKFLLEKVQGLIGEYNHLLTSQLEEQRTYLEHKLSLAKQQVLSRPEFQELALTVKALEAQRSEKVAQLEKLKQEERDVLKKAEQVRKRADITQEEVSLAIEVNKNLKYSMEQLQEQKPDIVQLKRIEQLKRQIAAKKESVASIRSDISEMMSQL